MKQSELKLGDLVEDLVTGIKGIATAKTEFLNGCVQVEVTPKVKDKEMSPEKAFGIGIDIQQLKRLGNGLNIQTKKIKKEKNGGPMRKVIRRAY
jgi:hypothetical protein